MTDYRTPKRVCLLGATFSTANMGMSALTEGALRGVSAVAPDAEVSIFDYHRNATSGFMRCDGREIPVVYAAFSKRLFRRNHIVRLLTEAALLRLVGSGRFRTRLVERSPVLSRLVRFDLFAAVSGGDSFSDIYGVRRFFYMALPQVLALVLRKRLVQLPQTYGPYRRRIVRATARWILSRSAVVASRDRSGIETVKRLLGNRSAETPYSKNGGHGVSGSGAAENGNRGLRRMEGVRLVMKGNNGTSGSPGDGNRSRADRAGNGDDAAGGGGEENGSSNGTDGGVTDRVRFCYDLAFLLSPREVDGGFKLFRERTATLVGINVSGLLYAKDGAFGLGVAYRRFVERLVERCLTNPDVGVMFVPHVYENPRGPIGDTVACADLYGKLASRYGERLFQPERRYDQAEVKYLIGSCDFFAGSRMHSCIAAMSQGVPTAGLAYSLKFAGVFESIGMEDAVVDLRTLSEEEAIARVESLFAAREQVRDRLGHRLGEIRNVIEREFRSMMNTA